MFTGEERRGKNVDMHTIFMQFQNLKKIKKGRFIVADDYVRFLEEFDKFHLVPLHAKDENYYAYLRELVRYLADFFTKTQPLQDQEKLFGEFKNNFEQAWNDGSLFGWEKEIQRFRGQISGDQGELYCMPCGKAFSNDSVFSHHKKGKRHIRAVNEMAASGMLPEANAPIKVEADPESEKKYRKIASLEFKVLRLRELLADVIHDTANEIRKNQTLTNTEREAKMEDDAPADNLSSEESGDEYPTTNPKNLPMGWDGKPIPYWLYKLHGLGLEFKCEICGGASYWGRRAFERHF